MTTMHLDHPVIQKAILEYEQAIHLEAQVKEQLEVCQRTLAVLLDLSDREIWHGHLEGYIKCLHRVKEERWNSLLGTNDNDAT